uniref:Large ribosomal subunit protein uL18m n=1 Tax=Rhipicephalus appendiculatus TaxID=34631 RepID=A0A131Z4V3_RHIAP
MASALLQGVRGCCRWGRRVLHSKSALSENDVVSSNFTNRNPRNLEQMLLAHKHGGFELDKPSCSYWHKLVFESSGQSVSGSVVHVDGHVVLRVSSSEWGIRKQLVSATDRSAAAAVASVLARRCLEAGLLCVQAPTNDLEGSVRLQAFLDGMKEGGVLLTEAWSPH